jgi:hypothetical protein
LMAFEASHGCTLLKILHHVLTVILGNVGHCSCPSIFPSSS